MSRTLQKTGTEPAACMLILLASFYQEIKAGSNKLHQFGARLLMLQNRIQLTIPTPSYLSTLCLGFLVCKMGNIIVSPSIQHNSRKVTSTY